MFIDVSVRITEAIFMQVSAALTGVTRVPARLLVRDRVCSRTARTSCTSSCAAVHARCTCHGKPWMYSTRSLSSESCDEHAHGARTSTTDMRIDISYNSSVSLLDVDIGIMIHGAMISMKSLTCTQVAPKHRFLASPG